MCVQSAMIGSSEQENPGIVSEFHVLRISWRALRLINQAFSRLHIIHGHQPSVDIGARHSLATLIRASSGSKLLDIPCKGCARIEYAYIGQLLL